MKITNITNMTPDEFRKLFLLDKNNIEEAYIVDDDMLITFNKPNSSNKKKVYCYDYANHTSSKNKIADSQINYISSINFNKKKSIEAHIATLRDAYIDHYYDSILPLMIEQVKNEFFL